MYSKKMSKYKYLKIIAWSSFLNLTKEYIRKGTNLFRSVQKPYKQMKKAADEQTLNLLKKVFEKKVQKI